MEPGWVLFILPKSGLGTKFRSQLDNTCGVIDSDYYYADNEGHIIISMTNDSKSDKTLEVIAGKAFVQAIFLPFGITEDDDTDGKRTGGFGSTGV
jgi:dUTP pyrophosphatase